MKPHWKILGALFLTLAVGRAAATTFYVNVSNPVPLAPYTNWPTAATNIQDAINAAAAGDQILVTNGVYETGASSNSGSNRVSVTKAVLLRSVNGPAVTIIKGYQVPGTTNGASAIRCVYLTSGATLSGFTLTNGATSNDGGGIFCTSSALVTNCVIVRNSALRYGGGAFSGTVLNCLLIDNVSLSSGGGAGASKLVGCLLMGNKAQSGGGAVFASLNHCTLVSNSATTGGGFRLDANDPNKFVQNSIIYNNSASNAANYLISNIPQTNMSFCCTTPIPTNGVGNITNEPVFVDLSSGNYRLQTNSPCINAGNNAYNNAVTDLDGRPRIVDGTVDMGAYEFQGAGMGEFIGSLQQYGLPTDGSADFIDSDGDGLNNWQEWIAGVIPTNAASVLMMNPPTNAVPGLQVSWQSVNTRTYFLQRSTNLLAAPAFTALQSNLPGGSVTTTFTDASATNGGPYFYRVGVQ
jgi:hypothetical protein